MDNHQRKETFQEALSRISREELETYYKTHNQVDTKEHFNIGFHNLKNLVKYYGIVKTREDITKCSVDTWAKKDTSIKNQTEKLLASISKESLENYYIKQNHSFEETCTHFNISAPYLIRLINEYNCYKPKQISHFIARKTKKERYGKETFNNREACLKTCLDKYGVTNVSQLDSTLEKMRETWLTHGYSHPMRNDTIFQKQQESWKKSFIENGGYGPHGIQSKPNKLFAELLTKNSIVFEQEFNIGRRSFDFKVGNILIEINPTGTHNSTYGIFGEPLDKTYHYNKTKLAVDSGYRCINVWDWDDVDKIVRLLLPMPSVYARKCSIKLVDKKEAQDFINIYHLQGYAKDSIRLGLYYNDELISIMTFDKPRYNKNYEYELVRYCSSYNVIGGAEKLFKHFLASYSPNSIISYCDLSKFTGNVYQKLGFTFKNYSIGKHWYNIKTGKHITDNLLRQRGFDQLLGEEYGYYGKGTSNEYLMLMNDFVEIFDAGQAVHIFTK